MLGPIITAIQKAGFEVTGLRMVLLDQSAAEEFLEIYCTVLPEYPAMVTQLCSGSCVALEVSGKDENTPVEFRYVLFKEFQICRIFLFSVSYSYVSFLSENLWVHQIPKLPKNYAQTV